jgi:hypothetical protein
MLEKIVIKKIEKKSQFTNNKGRGGESRVK